jgi:hypothetical protein
MYNKLNNCSSSFAGNTEHPVASHISRHNNKLKLFTIFFNVGYWLYHYESIAKIRHWASLQPDAMFTIIYHDSVGRSSFGTRGWLWNRNCFVEVTGSEIFVMLTDTEWLYVRCHIHGRGHKSEVSTDTDWAGTLLYLGVPRRSPLCAPVTQTTFHISILLSSSTYSYVRHAWRVIRPCDAKTIQIKFGGGDTGSKKCK